MSGANGSKTPTVVRRCRFFPVSVAIRLLSHSIQFARFLRVARSHGEHLLNGGRHERRREVGRAEPLVVAVLERDLHETARLVALLAVVLHLLAALDVRAAAGRRLQNRSRFRSRRTCRRRRTRRRRFRRSHRRRRWSTADVLNSAFLCSRLSGNERTHANESPGEVNLAKPLHVAGCKGDFRALELRSLAFVADLVLRL